MDESGHEQSSHCVIQDLTIGAIELRDRRENEGKRNVFKEVLVCAVVKKQWVGVVIGGGCLVGLVAVANEFVLLETAVHNTVGKVDEVGSEGEGPGASDCCCTKRLVTQDN